MCVFVCVCVCVISSSSSLTLFRHVFLYLIYYMYNKEYKKILCVEIHVLIYIAKYV